MSTLAIIPARGGSRGILRKNLVPIKGKPLVAHSIEHALQATSISRVIVSTDDSEIAEVARSHGAEVPFLRPSAISGDQVLDLPVFEHVLNWLEDQGQKIPDILVHLRPTAPYRLPGWIDQAVEQLITNPEADSVRSVSPVVQHPYRTFTIDQQGFLDPVMKHEHPAPYLLRRQDLPPIFYYNCVIDVTRPRTIRDKRSMTGERILPYFMDADDAFDIDTHRDLKIARSMLEG